MRIILVAAGGAHSIAVGGNEALYTWGRGNNGRLGHDDTKTHTTPQQVIALKDVSINGIACGHNFSVATTSDGHVYCWGKGDQGQCGYKYAQDQLAPRRVESLLGEYITSISCGYIHTLALGKNGSVWSWGHGEGGQLGISKSIYQPEPANLNIHEYLPDLDRIVQVCCGAWHSLALSQGGLLLSWGKNLHGVLGCDVSISSSPTPTAVKGLPSRGLTHVCAGRDVSFILKAGSGRRRSATPAQFVSSPELLRKSSEGTWKTSYVFEDARKERAKSFKINSYIVAWKEVLADWENLKGSNKTVNLYRRGIPPSMRAVIWPLAIGNHLKITPFMYNLYKNKKRLLGLRSTLSSTNEVGASNEGAGASNDKEDTMQLIHVDLPRTFPELRFFGGGEPFYNQLSEVLETFVCYRPDLGYIQGMSYLAAMICIYEPDDPYLSFQSLANLLSSHHLFTFYMLDQDSISRYVFYILSITYLYAYICIIYYKVLSLV